MTSKSRAKTPKYHIFDVYRGDYDQFWVVWSLSEQNKIICKVWLNYKGMNIIRAAPRLDPRRDQKAFRSHCRNWPKGGHISPKLTPWHVLRPSMAVYAHKQSRTPLKNLIRCNLYKTYQHWRPKNNNFFIKRFCAVERVLVSRPLRPLPIMAPGN